MKKVFVFILSLLYITSSIGVVLSLHYCINSPVANGINKSIMGGMCGHVKTTRKSGRCCKYENKLIKNVDEQKITKSTNLVTSSVHNALLTFNKISTTGLLSLTRIFPVGYVPPSKSNTALYIRNCVFRI